MPRRAPPCERCGVEDPLAQLTQLLVPGIEACRAQQQAYVVAITGSVAVGKSTIASTIAANVRAELGGLRVSVVSSDGFLLPNRVLDARGLAMRKGFPESYDREALLHFLAAVKAGDPDARVPRYSHEEYDVSDEYDIVTMIDVVVIEGLHLVQLSDAIDFTVFVDAPERDIEQWYVERFLHLRQSHAFYRQFASWSDDETTAFARQVWSSINGVNLHDYILPARRYADAILEKGADHSLRRLIVQRGSISA